ncbi:response regulator [Streptomyces shenzhenensis]|uniref:response regulator n=1 Tax=Streptomyces shenzhenensis TaxID=943815 RepID=UPI0033E361F1
MPSDAEILIVDDHQHTLYALEHALAPLGLRLGRATTSDEALKQVLRGRVGLLLLDVSAPGAYGPDGPDGLDVVRCIRRLEQTRHIPVVLLTGAGPDRELAAAAYGLGVADLVRAPVDPWALRTKVRHLYAAHQRTLALEREVRELRALVADRAQDEERGPRAARPHPDGRVPPQRDTLRTATTQDRT